MLLPPSSDTGYPDIGPFIHPPFALPVKSLDAEVSIPPNSRVALYAFSSFRSFASIAVESYSRPLASASVLSKLFSASNASI